ncbi:hypothetical protein UK82_28745 [Frankia sp. ACN1ag]|nr:hypothetical protein UK82_28745 [Frankia sp. ACN1ag]
MSGGGAVEADPVGSGERDATATTSDDGAGSAPAGPASVVSEPAVSEPAVSDSEAGELVGARS